MLFNVAKQLDLETWWCGFRFKSDELEASYIESDSNHWIIGCRCWSITHLLVYGGLFLPTLRFGYDISFYLSVIPSLIIPIVVFLLSVPPLQHKTRPRLLLIVCIAVVLISLLGIWQTVVYRTAYTSHVFQTDLNLVINRLQGDDAALAQLTRVFDERITESILNGYVIIFLPQVMLMIFIGFSTYTYCAVALMLIIFLVTACVNPHITVPNILQRGWVTLVFGAFFVAFCISVSLNRRWQFFKQWAYQSELKTTLAASRKADSILNHTLKNTMADAAGEIEIFLQDPSADSTAHLRQSYAALRRGMRSCRHRQAYLHLAMHSYVLSIRRVNLVAFAGIFCAALWFDS